MTPRGGSPQLTFRVGGIAADLDAREGTGIATSTAAVAKRDLTRYYSVIAAGQREIQRLGLSEAQACAIADALNGTIMLEEWDEGGSMRPVSMIRAELEAADRLNGLGEKWDIDVGVLVDRIDDLSIAGQYALVDAVERFWRDPDAAASDMLRSVGLVAAES